MQRILSILAACLLTTTCFAQEETEYCNTQQHFSFALGDNWEYIPFDELPRQQRQAIKVVYPKGGSLGVCKKNTHGYFDPPFILVGGGSTQEFSETIFDKMWQSKEGIDAFLRKKAKMIELIQNADGYLPKSWEGAEFTSKKFDYDPYRHVSFETLNFKHEVVGEIKVISVRFLGSHRLTTLRLYLDGDDAEDFLDLVNQVVDSFKYDEGYGFGEAKGVTSELVQKFLGNTWQSWLLWSVAIIIVSFLIHRWVTS